MTQNTLISIASRFSNPLLHRSEGEKLKYFTMSNAAEEVIDASATFFLAPYNLIKNVGHCLDCGQHYCLLKKRSESIVFPLFGPLGKG